MRKIFIPSSFLFALAFVLLVQTNSFANVSYVNIKSVGYGDSYENALNQALANPNLPQQVKDVLEQSKSNPKAIEEFLNQQADNLPTQLLTQIRDRKQELEQQAKTQSLKSSLRTGISSLLLAIGYITIGWTGLKGLGILRGGNRRKTPAA